MNNEDMRQEIEKTKQSTIRQVADAFDELARSIDRQLVLVGEKGPELVNGPRTSRVYMAAPQPGVWIGEWTADFDETVRTAIKGNDPWPLLFVSYMIPKRDIAGGYSAGGSESVSEYLRKIEQLSDSIKEYSHDTWVILEPDALGHLSALSDAAAKERITALGEAALDLSAGTAKVWMDVSMWMSPEDAAAALRSVPGPMEGFACNVSSYEYTDKVMEWADQVSALTGLRYIIDTSRNGNGNPHPGKWCNVTDTKIGAKPTTDTGNPRCAAFVWAKVAGESDGLGINDDGSHKRDDVPKAGEMWPEYRDAITSGDWTAFHAKYGTKS